MKAPARDEGPIFDADGYEDAPRDIAEAIMSGPRMPDDFLPPPDQLLKAYKQVHASR